MKDSKKLKTTGSTIKNELMLKSFAVDESINALAFADVDGNLFFVNKAFLTLWRLRDAKEVVGKSAFGLFKSPTEAEEIVQRVRAHGEWEGEITAIRPDQTEIILKFSAKILSDQEAPVALMASFVDITDLRKAEKVVKESEALLQLVLKTLPIGVLMMDKTGKLFYANERVKEINEGVSENQSIDDLAKHGARSYDTRTYLRNEDWGIYKTLTRGETILNQEIEIDSKEGSRKILSCSSVPVLNEKNEIFGGIVVIDDVTQNKRDLHIIKKTNKELQEIIDALDHSSLVSITDLKGNIIRVNSRFCQVARYEEHELLGRNHNIISSGYHQKDFWKDFWKTISKGEVWRGEIKNKAKDGTFYWVDTVVNPIHNEHGNLTHFLSIRQDITNRKEYETLLETKNNELKEITDALDQSSVVTLTDLDGNILRVNRKFSELTLYSEQEVLGKNHSIISSGYHDKAFWENLWTTIKKGEVWHGEIKNRKKDGTYYWVDTVINPIRNEHGVVTNFLSIRKEITDRKEYEALLETKNVELNEIIDALDQSSLVSITDVKGTIIKVNRRFCNIARYEEHELIGRNHNIISSGYHDKAFWKKFWTTISRGEVFHGEIRNKTKEGNYYWVDTVVNPIRNEHGKVTHFLSIRQDITERKNYESKLLQSNLDLHETKERLAEAQRLARLGYWEQNLITNTIWWSDIQFEIFGISKSELPKTNDEFIKLLHPDDRIKFTSILEGDARDAISNYRIIRPDGEIRVIEAIGQISYNEQGVPVKLSGINKDITELVEAENAIRESEQTLKNAQRIAKIGSWKLDVERDILEWSEETYRIFDVPTDKKPLSTHDFLTHVHPEDKEYVTRAWDAALKGERYEVVHRIIVNNEIRWVAQQTELTFNEYPKLVRAFGTVQDVTDQIILRNNNLVFNQSQSLAGIGSWRFSVKNKDLFWSDSVYELFGIDKATTAATNEVYLNAIYPEDRVHVMALGKDSQDNQKPYEVEYRVALPSGQIRWIQEKGDVLKDNKGQVVQMFGIVRDITNERHNTEELVKARHQAEEAAAIKDEFLSVMSHEIRTPLNSVIGLSNLLLKRTPREDQLTIMKTLKGSADNLMHLVNDILDFNKIRAGKLELESIPFSLNKFLQHLHASFSLAAQDRGLNFSIQSDPRIPDALVGDITRMNQIFNNLLNNAIKFTHEGHVKLEVDLKNNAANACTILFKVEDSGVGIPADKLSTVFVPFQQSERSTSRKYGGTGLGLSIVKTLVEIMDGKINLSSQEGVGTVFELQFEFPISHTQDDHATMESDQAPSGKANNNTLKLEILYVEDVESNRFLIKNLLSDYHINCQTVSSGQAALKLTKLKKFDLILMDIQMPRMDGYQATGKIRKQPDGRNNKTNIIAFTAEPYSEALRSKIIAHDIQDVISKPFDPDQLINKINALTISQPDFFSFAFYAKAFSDDVKKLRSVKKTVIKDLTRFETNLLKYDKTGNVKGIRAEIHKMRPIARLLECKPLYELLDHIKWPDDAGYSPDTSASIKQAAKLSNQLLTQIEALNY